jgi:hypothetical protein
MDTGDLLFTLRDAFNSHDIVAFGECFDENYYSEQPAHPDRTFQGREQVVKNWASNFEEMPDFFAHLIRHDRNHETIWSEWEWQGTRRDNSKLFMRGVMIMGIQKSKITWARLYVEPVEESGKGIQAAIEEVMQGRKSS